MMLLQDKRRFGICVWQIPDTQHTCAYMSIHAHFTLGMCMFWTFTSLSEAALLSSASFLAFSASFLATYNKMYCTLHMEHLMRIAVLFVGQQN